jgi:hypothetical protein
MDSATYLAMLRRRLKDVSPAAERFTDDELWEQTQDMVLELTVRPPHGFVGYTVTLSGFTPYPTDEDGLLILTKVQYTLLRDIYRDKINRGELGGSWKSGLEEESTIDSRKAFADVLVELEKTLDELIILRSKLLSGSRVQ